MKMKAEIINIITDLACLIWGHTYESYYCECCERHIITGERYCEFNPELLDCDEEMD